MRFPAVLATLAILSLVSAPSSFSDTLQLVSRGGQVVDDVYFYPYNFSIN